MKKREKILWILLLLGLVQIIGLTACGKKKTVKLGRFEEKQIELPSQIKDKDYYQILDISCDEKNRLQLLIFGEEVDQYTLEKDGSYTRTKVEWINKLLKKKDVGAVYYTNAGDDSQYVIVEIYSEKGNYSYQCFRHTKDNPCEEIKLEDINKVNEDGYIQTVEKIQALEGGNLLVGDTLGVVVYDKNGKRIWDNEDGLGLSAMVAKGVLYVLDANDTSSILTFDVESGKSEKKLSTGGKKHSYGDLTTQSYGILGVDQEENLYLQNSNGIRQWQEGKSKWVDVVKGSATTLSLPGLQGNKIYKSVDGCYYITCLQDNKGQVYSYTYNPKIPSSPEKKLTIYSLNESKVLRTGVVQFQKDHPEVEIDYTSPLEEGDTSDPADYLNALNTELLSGGGADLLILDKTRVEDYVRKGILIDLNDIVKPMIKNGKISDKIAKTYEKDGKIYAIPQRLGIPVLYGNKDDLKNIDGMDAMIQKMTQSKDYLSMTKEDAAQMLYEMYYPELCDQDGTYQEDALKRYFEVMGQLKYSDLKTENIAMSACISLREKLERVGCSDLSSAGSVQYACDYLNELGKNGKICSPMGTFQPILVTGINQASKCPELAKEFLEFMFSVKGTEHLGMEGLSIQKELMEKEIAKGESMDEYSSYLGYDMEDGEFKSIKIPWPSKSQIKAVDDIYDQIDTPVMPGSVEERKIVDAALKIAEGKAKIEDVLQEVMGFLNTRQQELK